MPAKRTSHLPVALLVDLVLVAVFAVVGHYTHEHSLEVAGLVRTAWPFLAALAAAWVLNAVWSAPLAPLRTGAGIWATTVLVGMIIRFLAGQSGTGIPGTFLIVAASFNLLTLVGWRLIATAVAGRSR
ncbi:DUF3054 family protein [Brevibacterium sp. 5221]|uniref:DUF3054 family protein n=1 Tax=Brevibacterium rongguiense TaxID=2695267 RepID=A0A6N9H5N6_9MICO|nr:MULTISPECIES: DUF3054 domain-containing protein [Brevibacterium]MYM18934.1 DUF3054 family protein [Brevibacterium rongguiense]WAL40780.1 DUF3054 domain-containing protein [Brevibacterium sp. BRM-1]